MKGGSATAVVDRVAEAAPQEERATTTTTRIVAREKMARIFFKAKIGGDLKLKLFKTCVKFVLLKGTGWIASCQNGKHSGILRLGERRPRICLDFYIARHNQNDFKKRAKRIEIVGWRNRL